MRLLADLKDPEPADSNPTVYYPDTRLTQKGFGHPKPFLFALKLSKSSHPETQKLAHGLQ